MNNAEVIINKLFQVWIASGMWYRDFKYFIYELSSEMEIDNDFALAICSIDRAIPRNIVEYVKDSKPVLYKIDGVKRYGVNLRITPNIEEEYICYPWCPKMDKKVKDLYYAAFNEASGTESQRYKELKNYVYGAIMSYEIHEDHAGMGGCLALDKWLEKCDADYETLRKAMRHRQA